MKNILIILGVIIVVALGVYFFPRESSEVQAPTMIDEQALSGTMVSYYNDTAGYLALPEGDGPFPALVLIHEWWGLNDDIKSTADRFADEGYVALAVDMYNGESTTDRDRARTLSGAVRENLEEGFANLQAAVDYLKARPEVADNKLAAVGWCFGGGWSYQMARNDLDIEGSVMYYGQFDPEDDFDMMRASILGHFGEEDAAIAIDNVREFQAALETTNGEHDVYIYPNVGHGFANYRDGDNLAYDEESAELAWQRTREFLSQLFR